MFSRARNLLEESECSSRDVLSPAAKKQKVQALDPDLCDVLMTTEGCAPEAMVITISDECCDEVSKAETDKIVLQALSFAPGTYHQIHDDLNGFPVFRQEPNPGGCNDEQLFLFYSLRGNESGFYLADRPFNTNKEKDLATVYMYFSGTDLGTLDAHCPYWARQSMPGIKVRPLTLMMQEMSTRMEELEGQLALACSALDAMHETKMTAEAGELQATDDHQKSQGRGGWMPKMASAMTLWYLHRSRDLNNLFNSWYNHNKLLAEMVDRGIYSGKIKHAP